VKDKEEVERLLQHHEAEIVDLEQSMSALDDLVAKWKGERPKDEVPDEVGDDIFDNDDMVNEQSVEPPDDVTGVEKDDDAQHSNMYDRMKAQPRRRFKSVAIKTPFSVYGKKKFKSLKMG